MGYGSLFAKKQYKSVSAHAGFAPAMKENTAMFQAPASRAIHRQARIFPVIRESLRFDLCA